jgi:ABC-type nitrate/sulfonate/bicarbonate transport system substrate-binding protein
VTPGASARPNVPVRRWLLRLLAAVLAAAAVHPALATGGVEGAPESRLPEAPEPPRSVIFMAGFKPQANLPFVAAYVAREQGYFAEQGLAVTIHHSTGQHLQLLLSGDVDVTTAAAGSVLKRRADPGVPIRAIALFGQRGQQTFIALADSGIDSPRDWEGRTVGYRISLPPEYLAIADAAGVNRELVQEVRVGFDPRILVQDKVDVLAVFKSNEPDTLRKLGFDVVQFDPAAFGVPALGLTYIAREDLITEKPDLIAGFVKAALKGLAFSFSHPEETLDIVMRYADKEDRDHMRFMLEAEQADAVSAVTEQHGLGAMTLQQWQEFHDLLMRYGALARELDVDQAFTTQFLEAAYEEGRLVWP